MFNSWKEKVKFINLLVFCIRWFLNRSRKRSGKKEIWKSEGLNIVYWMLIYYLRDRLARSIQNPWKMAVQRMFEFFFFFFLLALCFFSRKNNFGHDLYSCPFVLILLIPHCFFSKLFTVTKFSSFFFFSRLNKVFLKYGKKKKKRNVKNLGANEFC